MTNRVMPSHLYYTAVLLAALTVQGVATSQRPNYFEF